MGNTSDRREGIQPASYSAIKLGAVVVPLVDLLNSGDTKKLIITTLPMYYGTRHCAVRVTTSDRFLVQGRTKSKSISRRYIKVPQRDRCGLCGSSILTVRKFDGMKRYLRFTQCRMEWWFSYFRFYLLRLRVVSEGL